MSGVLEAFVALFVIMDPIGILPFVVTITKGMPANEAKRNIKKSIFVAGTLLFIFLFLGLRIFEFFNINLNSFQIAGGIIFLIIGISYVFGLPHKFVKAHGADLSVPVGTPLLAGPGAIMTTIILVKENGHLVTVIAAFFALFSAFIILTNYSKVYKILGQHWTNVVSRVMGIILASIAVEFIANGVSNIIKALI